LKFGDWKNQTLLIPRKFCQPLSDLFNYDYIYLIFCGSKFSRKIMKDLNKKMTDFLKNNKGIGRGNEIENSSDGEADFMRKFFI